MKKLLLFVFIAISLSSVGQERINSKPASLSYKSKEIKSALYWEQNRKTGQWESRKNTTLVYLGEGVAIDNFNSLFIGDYKGHRYLFLDFKEYSWRYPSLQMEWIVSRTIMAAILSKEDYDNLHGISDGELLIIKPRFYHKMFKGHPEYSFPFFLSLGETLRSSSETLYQSNKKAYGEDYAERLRQKDCPPIDFIVIKRTTEADGRDVIRFTLYPHALPELINSSYFEVAYSTYQNLFTEDKKRNYK